MFYKIGLWSQCRKQIVPGPLVLEVTILPCAPQRIKQFTLDKFGSANVTNLLILTNGPVRVCHRYATLFKTLAVTDIKCSGFCVQKIDYRQAVVVAQLVERLLQTPEIRGSNPVTGNFIYYQLYQITFIDKAKIKKKRPGMVQF